MAKGEREREAPPPNQLAMPAESRYAVTVAGSGLNTHLPAKFFVFISRAI